MLCCIIRMLVGAHFKSFAVVSSLKYKLNLEVPCSQGFAECFQSNNTFFAINLSAKRHSPSKSFLLL